MTALPRIDLQIHPAAVPVTASGWYLAYGYGTSPLILWASAGQTAWRQVARIVPITHYAGPLPEMRR